MIKFETAQYWENRYSSGGNSGQGSYGILAEYKALILNQFVALNQVDSIVEWGCGDGNQLRYAKYPNYLGLDISQSAVDKCNTLFAGDKKKNFKVISDYDNSTHDLSMSLDVLYHLIEDDVYNSYLTSLFSSSRRWVIIYANDADHESNVEHVKQRKFSTKIDRDFSDWRLHSIVFNRHKGRFSKLYGDIISPSDFYFYEKVR